MNTVLATQNPASEAQVKFLHSLFDQKFDADKAQTCHEWLNTHTLSKSTASAKITELKDMPTLRHTFADTEDLEVGLYLVDGVAYKVKRAVYGSGFLYACRWDEESTSFVKESGAIRKIRANHRMTLEQAAPYGLAMSACAHCGRPLTDETSIKLGLGPVCAGKYS
jgi:hypothetical protein